MAEQRRFFVEDKRLAQHVQIVGRWRDLAADDRVDHLCDLVVLHAQPLYDQVAVGGQRFLGRDLELRGVGRSHCSGRARGLDRVGLLPGFECVRVFETGGRNSGARCPEQAG